ncbi:MAG TPA: YceI family protein [Gaiellales bacterium]|jgi:polyisoprenoid-binding protein YceI|nr:YceI family protein [Gaiellales bacterium]
MSAIAAPDQTIPAGTWKIDPKHSRVEFSIRHMGIATINGAFTEFEGTLVGGEAPSLAGTIKVASVDTRDKDRDGHLQTPDFFDAERHPELRFTSTRFQPGKVVGELTIRGVTREVELEARVSGAGTDPWGNERLGIELEGEIDRHDFGVSWNTPLPTGGLLLGDRVRLSAGFSAVKEA